MDLFLQGEGKNTVKNKTCFIWERQLKELLLLFLGYLENKSNNVSYSNMQNTNTQVQKKKVAQLSNDFGLNKYMKQQQIIGVKKKVGLKSKT